MLHQVRVFDKLEHAASNVSEIDKVEGKKSPSFTEGEAEQTAQASERDKKADKEEKRGKDSCCKAVFKAKDCK